MVHSSLSHWHILGAGAIGGLWAIRLLASGHRVTLIERHPSATPHRQVCLIQDGQETCRDILVLPAHSHVTLSPLLVTTKAGDTAAALAPLFDDLQHGDIVLLLQNGMGVDEWLRQQRPDLRILTGITTDGVFRKNRNTLVLAGAGKTLLGGETHEEQELAARIARQWREGGALVEAVPDIRLQRWQKLATNCAINPLTALYRCRNGELESNAEALATMRTLCAEVAATMQAEGLPANGEDLFVNACRVARQTAANTSSMLADVMAGRNTEIDFMNAHVVRVASRHGIPTPANRAITQAIRALYPPPATAV